VDVRERQRKRKRRDAGGEHLEAVAEKHEDVGSRPLERLGERADATTNRTCYVARRVARAEEVDTLDDRVPIAFDLVHGVTEAVEEMHAPDIELQTDVVALRERTQNGTV